MRKVLQERRWMLTRRGPEADVLGETEMVIIPCYDVGKKR